ncbi:hypothetical protein COO60DRAFT_625239 [Scenedesmus sp. NREL 46B-D3]|nr:hypothetical protein COO60DRAFT_625239 [Scenedesmus sp. NREL 46B-D3]
MRQCIMVVPKVTPLGQCTAAHTECGRWEGLVLLANCEDLHHPRQMSAHACKTPAWRLRLPTGGPGHAKKTSTAACSSGHWPVAQGPRGRACNLYRSRSCKPLACRAATSCKPLACMVRIGSGHTACMMACAPPPNASGQPRCHLLRRLALLCTAVRCRCRCRGDTEQQRAALVCMAMPRHVCAPMSTTWWWWWWWCCCCCAALRQEVWHSCLWLKPATAGYAMPAALRVCRCCPAPVLPAPAFSLLHMAVRCCCCCIACMAVPGPMHAPMVPL